MFHTWSCRRSRRYQQLWQDVERVIENSSPAPGASIAENQSTLDMPEPEQAQFTEPIPWGAPPVKDSPKPAAGVAQKVDAISSASDTSTERRRERDNSPEVSIENSSSLPPAIAEAIAEQLAKTKRALHDDIPPADPVPPSTKIPALESMNVQGTSPSPIVHPLRPTQRKRKSLSAVELPSFPPLPKQKKPAVGHQPIQD